MHEPHSVPKGFIILKQLIKWIELFCDHRIELNSNVLIDTHDDNYFNSNHGVTDIQW